MRVRTLAGLRILGLLGLVVLLSARAASGDEAVLPFWLDKGTAPGPNVVEVRDDCPCCGLVAHARVDRIPAADAPGPLRSEAVLELDASGAVVTRWSIPMDTEVRAIDGRALVLFGAIGFPDTMLRVFPDGSFRVIEQRPELASPEFGMCPATLTEFEGSAYLVCATFQDLRTRAARRLAYEFPCS
jgi:hypothetical protein